MAEITRTYPELQTKFLPCLTLLAFCVYFAIASYRLGIPDLQQDEGCFGVSALNILHDHHQLALVAETPDGPAATKPFLYPLALAVAIAVLGKSTFVLKLVNVIALALASGFLYALVWVLLKDRLLAVVAFAFFLLNPGTITYARTVTAEPFVVLWGCAALFTGAKFCEMGQSRWALLCGVCLGLGFLSKLWIVAPFGLGCFVLFAVKYCHEHGRRIPAGVMTVGMLFILVSSLHLILVWWMTPADLQHWIGIYFGHSFSTRVMGGGYDPALWFRPWWFYGATLFKASFFALPMVFLGARTLLVRHELMTAAPITALLSAVVVLSLFRVKEAVYIFPVFPALALLMAAGFRFFIKAAGPAESALAALLSVLVTLPFAKLEVISSRELMGLCALHGLVMVAAFADVRFRVLTRFLVTIAVLSAMMFAGTVVVQKNMEHQPRYREIATYFEPQLQSYRPNDIAFTAPEFASFAFSTFHNGEYWETYYFHKSLSGFIDDLKNGRQVFYVVDPSGTLYGGKISPDKLVALHEYAVDITPHIERAIGHRISLQVFIPVTQRAAKAP